LVSRWNASLNFEATVEPSLKPGLNDRLSERDKKMVGYFTTTEFDEHLPN